jgi:hypothetical protein
VRRGASAPAAPSPGGKTKSVDDLLRELKDQGY